MIRSAARLLDDRSIDPTSDASGTTRPSATPDPRSASAPSTAAPDTPGTPSRLPTAAPTSQLVDDATSDGCVTFDANGRIVEIDASCASLLDPRADDLLGSDIGRFLDAHIIQTIEMAGAARRHLPATRYRGDFRLTNVRLTADRTSDHRVDLVVRHHLRGDRPCTTLCVREAGVLVERRKIVERLSRFSTLAKLAPVGIVQLTAHWTCLYANDMWTELTRLSAGESAGFGWIDAIHPDEMHDFVEEMHRDLERDRVFHRKVRLQPPHGPTIWATINMTAILDADGQIEGSLLVASDVTENHHLLERLHDMAHKDALTGLWNRTAWLETLDRRIASVERPGQLGVLYIDLDGFKAVNDTVGHDHGDALLKAVAERLLAAVRAEDMLARLGGDEFAVVMPELEGEKAAAAVAQRIVRAVAQPFTILGKELSVGASVGIALADTLAVDRTTLVKRADTALYAAKHAGRSRHVFYDEEQDREQRERSALSVAVRRAVDTMAFTLHYQPQVDMATDRIVGFEALLRVEPGAVPPGVGTETLVEVLESTGLIGTVGEWALDSACRQLARWRRTHALDPAVTMSVNVSGRQLGLPGFVDDVARVLERHALPPSSLIVEITESVLVDTRDSDVVDRLKALGVRIALDDFGKGYSSLAYLGRLPLDHLKIDRSFVESLATSDEARKIVRCIVALARSLGMQVTAEGIEDAGTLEFLLEEGCHDWQGYLFSRPVDAAAIEALLFRERRWHAPRANAPTPDASRVPDTSP